MNESSSTTLSRHPAASVAAVLLVDAAGRITTASQAARTLWQAGERELIGDPLASLFVFDVVSDSPDWAEAQWDVLLGATLDRTATLIAQPREGAPRDVRIRLERFAENTLLATVQAVESAGSAASAEVQHLQQLANDSSVGFFDLNLVSGAVTYSRSWKRLLGYVESELADTLETWRERIHPDDSSAAPDQLGKKLTAGTRPFSVEFRMRHRLGHWVWIHCIGVQVVGAAGGLERVVGVTIDISERKELEEASLASDERLNALAAGPLGVFDLDFANGAFWYSSAWKRLLGYGAQEMGDELATFAAVLPPEEATGGAETWLQLLAPGQSSFVVPVTLIAKDGQLRSLLLGAQRTLNRKRDLARVVGFLCAPATEPALDTGAGAAAATDMPADHLLADAFDALAEAVLVTDAEGRILHANLAATNLLQRARDEVVGAPVSKVFRLVHRESGQPGDDPCARALATDRPLPLCSEHALLRDNPPSPDPGTAAVSDRRSIVWTAHASRGADGSTRGVVVIFRDPEEMGLTPEELIRADRFESLGLLAGGIAHDFNNLLATILGGISLAKDNRDPSALADSEKACLTAKGLTKQLLLFAKGGTGTQTVVAAREILEDAVKIAAAGSDAEISIEVADGVDPIRVDRAQMLQVFQNLVVNALQAMPPSPHRARMQLSARMAALTEGQIPPLPAGTYVEIEVRDNGAGIAPENLQRIFDPFFTTKKHGTGLGLATVLSIVRKHGGQIGVDSTVGAGTAFTVFLPRADAPVEVQPRRAPSLRFGTGRVLFMDDDPKLSSLTANMLQSLDYKFDLARNGEEAIQLYKRYLNIGRPYDAVILDITVVGGMGGEECFRALRDLDPEVRAIVSTGYDNEVMHRRFLDLGFCNYLTKPYRVAELGKALKSVIG